MKSSILHYTAAVLLVGLTLLLKGLLEALVGPGPPLLLYVPAVTFAAWLGGLGPGLLAAALSSCVCLFVHLPPIGSLWLQSANDRVRFVVFIVEGVLLSVCMEMRHSARRRSEASIQEAMQYQDELGRSEGRLRAILDNSPSVILLKDSQGRYLLANRGLEVLTGLTPDRVLGKADADIFPAEVAEKFRSNDLTVLERGEPIEWEEVLGEDDGPHTLLSTKFPLLDAAGTVYAVGGIATDITERKRAEQALRQRAAVPRALSALAHRHLPDRPRGPHHLHEPAARRYMDSTRLILWEMAGRGSSTRTTAMACWRSGRGSRRPAASSRWSVARWGPVGRSAGSTTRRCRCSRITAR